MSTKIKSIKIITSSDLMGIVFENSENSYISSYKQFDENQNVVIEKEFSADGLLETYNQYSYNSLNQLIETKLLDENDIVLESHNYFYENNKLTKEHVHYGENEYEDVEDFYDIVTYEYNQNDQLISKTSIETDGELNSEKKYEYEGNNLFKELIYGENKQLEIEIVNQYDEFGNIINELRIDHIENIKNKLEHQYNELQLKTSTHIYNNFNELVSKTFFDYNSKKQLITVIEESRESFVVKKYEYDDNGNIRLENFYNKDEELMQYKVFSYQNENILQIDQYVFSPESIKSDEDGYLLNGSLKYEYEMY